MRQLFASLYFIARIQLRELCRAGCASVCSKLGTSNIAMGHLWRVNAAAHVVFSNSTG